MAAFVLPPVIHKYRIKQLETAFKKNSVLIEQALQRTATELGYISFKELDLSLCRKVSKAEAIACITANAETFNEIQETFLKQLKIVDRPMYWDWFNKNMYGHLFREYDIVDYSGTWSGLYSGTMYGMDMYKPVYILADGTMLANIMFYAHEPSGGITLAFDTNGPFKGPNRYGYDIFMYNTGSWYKICSKQYSNIYNGRGCYDYALKNQNPDDKTKGYWESLDNNFSMHFTKR